jgi:hypothetical protein
MVKRPVLVEIKPALTFAELYQYKDKIERSGWNREALILGVHPMWKTTDSMLPMFGLMAERVPDREPTGPESYWWAPARIFRCKKCGRLNFTHEDGSWHGRICGHYDGNHLLAFDKEDALNIRFYWAQATNVTRWKPKSMLDLVQ